jgi:hypothetical protein
MNSTRRSALAVLALSLTSCYHAVVDTGRPPGTTVIDKPWTNTFVFGLVPASEIDTAAECPRGIARVDTEQSFLNGLVGALTLYLYTPQHVRITCAAGAGGATGALPNDRVIDAGASRGARAAAVNEAAALADSLGGPVFVRF